LLLLYKNIVSCFILTQDVDKHAFKFMVQTSPGKWRNCNGRPTGAENRVTLGWQQLLNLCCAPVPRCQKLEGHVPPPSQWRRRLWGWCPALWDRAWM